MHMLLSTVHQSSSQDLFRSFGRAKGRCPSNEFEGVQYALWQGEGSCRKNEISCFVPPTFGSAVASSSSSSFTFVPPFSRYLLSIYSFHCINGIYMFGVLRCTAFGLGQRARARDPQSLWEDWRGSRPISLPVLFACSCITQQTLHSSKLDSTVVDLYLFAWNV